MRMQKAIIGFKKLGGLAVIELAVTELTVKSKKEPTNLIVGSLSNLGR